jgi:hypothetical protein
MGLSSGAGASAGMGSKILAASGNRVYFYLQLASRMNVTNDVMRIVQKMEML